MRVAFYLPEHHMPGEDRREAWQTGGPLTLEQAGKSASAQSWVYQTWAFLCRAGVPADLVREMPRTGIVVTITGCLPPHFDPPRGLYVAGIMADGLPHPGAHLHILQNSAHARMFPGAVFMPHWPQPGLQAREPERGATFERVCFFGDEANLAPELRDQQWQDELFCSTGARLEIRGAERWHDYSDVDAVVAIRDFSGRGHPHKPATKLYNAWLAGVPLVGGSDAAFRSDGRPGNDYLEARSPEETLSVLLRLKQDGALRHRLVKEGTASVRRFTPEAVTQQWKTLVEEELPRLASRELNRPEVMRRLLFHARRLWCRLDLARPR
jgi:hypothetical protein